MDIIKKPKKMLSVIAEERKGKGGKIGFVPTLGCLHEGHEALIKKAKKECDIVVVSIFVNRLQFTKKAYDAYPRTPKEDRALLEKLGVDFLFTPSEEDIYPNGFDTVVEVKELTGRLEGAKIRWHYRGVTTIVAKLFNIVRPDRAYFGKKDPHQLAIIKRMNSDLDLGVKIVAIPTKRAKDGLALSSRNTLLTKEEREAALVISRAINIAGQKIKSGDKNRAALTKKLVEMIEAEKLAKIDYAAVVDTDSLKPEDFKSGSTLVYVAAYIGKWRLTDNKIFK